MSKVKLLVVVFSIILLSQVFLGSAATGTGDSWIAKASMPTGRLWCESVADTNCMIYVIGGSDVPTDRYSMIVGVNEMYNPDTDTWTAKKSMPTPRENFGLATSQNKIYAIGGRLNSYWAVTSVNEVYDIVTDTWEKKASLPSARACVDANVVNGKIYVIGGRSSAYFSSCLNDTLVYDIESDVWCYKEPPPINIGNYVSAVIDNKIYILFYETGPLWIYDTDADKWSQGAAIPISGYHSAMCATTGEISPKRLYVMGGGLDVVQTYEPATNKWSKGIQMSTERYAFSIAVLNDNIYTIGGASVDGRGDANEVYTPGTYYKISNPQINSTIVVVVAIIMTLSGIVLIRLKIKKTRHP